jgi:hypothetical protein
MASDSMFDFGAIAKTMIGLGQLQQEQRRNDIYEENAITSMGQLKVQQQNAENQQQKIRQDNVFRGFDELEKIAKSPQFVTDPIKQVDVRFAQLGLLKHGLGMNIPIPSREDLLGSTEAFGKMLKQAMTGTPEDKLNASMELAIAAPEYMGKVLDDMKKAGDWSDRSEQLKIRLDLDKAQLQALNIKSGRVALQGGLLTEHLGAIGTTLGLTEHPEYKEHYTKVRGFEKPETRQAYLSLHKDFKEAFAGETSKRRYAMISQIQSLKETLGQKQALLSDQQEKYGVAPADLQEEVRDYQLVLKARQAEADFLDNPYEKDNWKNLTTQQQNLKIQYGMNQKAATGIEAERLGFLTKKFDIVQQEKAAASLLDEEFLANLGNGMDDNQSALQALKTVQQQFPGVAVDTGKLKNLNKVGKQEVSVSMGKEDVSRNLKLIEASQGVLDYAKDMADLIRANPMIVGKGAQAGTAFAGAGQQLRALAQLDPGASKFLNTKTRDNAEALHEILVYLQAKTLDPTGALDLKVVEHARQTVGDISSYFTGPQQILNKLDQVTANSERNIRHARRRITGGVGAYLRDESPVSDKKVGEMTEQELMRAILQGGKE